jgi:Domain of unknown function (DUF5103)
MMVQNGLMRVRSVPARTCGFVVLAVLLHLLGGCVPVSGTRGARGGNDSLYVAITRVLDLRIHGAGDPGSPPILRLPVDGKATGGIGSDALTIEFEMQSDVLPNITLQLVHCDRNWVPTENVFIQDPFRLRSNDIEMERSPIGASHYDYICRVTFPRVGSKPEVTFSGNYLARVVDYYDQNKILAEGRFFAVEPRAGVSLSIASDFYESTQTAVLQHGLKIFAEATPNFDLFGGRINAIHLYPAGQWYSPMKASEDFVDSAPPKGAPWITWRPAFAGKSSAEFRNIPAGNEHRLLDLSDIFLFPTTGGLMSTPLSDIPRSSFNYFDNNGIPPKRFVPLSDADYVYFEFRLDLQGQNVKEDIFVVGTFNNWVPTAEWMMHYDKTTGFYIARGLIRRAFHEYEYRAGNWDADNGVLRNAEATLLEGNLSNSSLPYYAMTYYYDTSNGVFDRLIGIGVDISGWK